MLGETEGVFKPICMPVLVRGGVTAGSESSLEIIKPTKRSFALILLLYALIETHDNQQYLILKISPSASPFPQQTHYKRAANQQGEKQA